MRGFVLTYDPQASRGVIRAEDGIRYNFIKADWLSDSRPAVSDPVDFEPIAELATEIYLMRPSARAADAARPPAREAPKPAEPARTAAVREAVARRLGEEPPVVRPERRRPRFTDPHLVLAVLSLGACLLPYVSFGYGTLSLASVGSLAQQIESLGALLRAGMADTFVWSVRAIYLIYLIPLFAGAILAYGLAGRRARGLAFWHGIASIFLPFGVPLLAATLASGQRLDLDSLRELLSFGDRSIFNFVGIGFWAIVAIGVLQVAALLVSLRRRADEPAFVRMRDMR